MVEHPHDRDSGLAETPRVARDRKRQVRRTQGGHDAAWAREDFFHDLGLASRRITQEIEADPGQAAALDRSQRQAREGKVISQEEMDAELASGDDS